MGFKENFKSKMEDRSYEERIKKNYARKREQSEDRANGYSYFLAGVCVLIAVLFFIYKELWLGIIFLGVGGLLVLMVYLSKKEESKDSAPKYKNKKK